MPRVFCLPCIASTVLVLALLALAGSPVASAQPGPNPTAARPNFVVLVVDDAGFMDFGAFGGEARTPNIDALAARGAVLSRYRTSPLCSPSRAMLLTGVDNHRTGLATIPEVLPPSQRGQPGYEMRLDPGLLTLAERLRAIGYRTYMTGKWHLGSSLQDLPNSHGFDRSFALEASGADNWAHKSYMPYYASAPWYEDGRPVRRPDGPYSSTLIIDRMLGYLAEEPNPARPFLAYIGFQAVHIPVQAPGAITETYVDTYRGGWEELRQRRWQRARALGFAPTDAPAPLPAAGQRPWSSLTPEQQALSSRSMAVYAAMLEAMDLEIGRLIAALRARGQLDNTVFVLTSDNGPEPSAPGAQTGFPTWMALNGYRHTLGGLGEAGSHNWIGPEWAEAIAAPGRLFKFYATEGGVRVPLVMAGPGIQPGLLSDANAFVTDITPTLLALAGVPDAGPSAAGMDGRSLLPVLSGQAAAVYGPNDAIGIEVSGNRALILGHLKLLTVPPPYGDGSWRLYDVVADPGETRDLSAARPEDKARLLDAYNAYVARNGVLPLPDGYQAERQVAINSLKRQGAQGGPALAAIGALALALIGVLIWRRRRRKAQGTG